jgi:hypothetical protein
MACGAGLRRETSPPEMLKGNRWNSRNESAQKTIPMVELAIEDGKVKINVKGADKLWSFRSTLEIPLAHIAGVRADGTVDQGWWKGFCQVGTYLPGVITAGTFYHHGKKIFWDVHHPENTIVFELHDERYDELIVEVADPSAALNIIRDALPKASK